MRILFIGAVEISSSALRELVKSDAHLVGVIGSAVKQRNSDFSNLKPQAEVSDVPFLAVDDINSPLVVSWITDRHPDVTFCFGWSRLLGADTLKACGKLVVGFHPAKLPYNRGRHPLIWALALGLKETAITFFEMSENPDSGRILLQREVPISYEDVARTLYDRVQNVACESLGQLLGVCKGCLSDGNSPKDPRDNMSSVSGNEWRKRSREDGLIDFRMSSYSIYNLVRALSDPYPGAEFCHKGSYYRVFEALELKGRFANIEPGKVLRSSSMGVVIKCGTGCICFKQIVPELAVKAGDYIR